MNNVKKIEVFYTENFQLFQKIESDLFIDFNIPETITKDTIKRLLIDVVDVDNGRFKHLVSKVNLFTNLFEYLGWMGYFLYFGVFGQKNKSYKCDILYEEWNDLDSHYNKFYKHIDIHLSSLSSKVLFISSQFKIRHTPSYVIDKHSKFNCDRSIAWKILKKSFNKYIFYFQLGKDSNFQLNKFYYILLRQIAKYETHSKDLTSKIMISACHNGYSALRYFIYKKNGIKNILLIQNGICGSMTAMGGELYVYTDIFVSYGNFQLERLIGLQAKEKFTWGSIPLSEIVDTIKNITIEYDILFIEEGILQNVPGSYNPNSYETCLNNFIKFSQLYPEVKSAYRIRPSSTVNSQTYNMLQTKGIIVDNEQSKNSYVAMAKAKVIVTYASSMGFEAIGIGKKTLFCNYDHFSYLPTDNTSMEVVLDRDFEAFKEKLLALLLPDYRCMEHFSKLKSYYMNLNGNPANKISNYIAEKYFQKLL